MDIRFKLSLPSISRSFRVKFMRFWVLRVAASLHCFGFSLGWRCLQVDRFFSHGQPLNGRLPNVQIVFQSFALFPWLTVLQNVEAPLRALGIPIIARHKRALRMLDIVGLDRFETA